MLAKKSKNQNFSNSNVVILTLFFDGDDDSNINF